MWDAEESARRGFASPRKWKEQLSSCEYERLKAISRKWHTGVERRDWGLIKAALFIGSCMAKIGDFDVTNLLPNPPPECESTPEEILAALQQIDRKWPQAASEH